MGFFSNIIGAAVKVVAIPVVVAKDITKVAVGVEPDSTKNLIKSATSDIGKAFDNLGDLKL